MQVDYDNFADIWDVNLASRWLAIGGIMVGLLVIILLVQKKKDII